MDDSPALVLVTNSPTKLTRTSQRPTSETTIFSIYSMYGEDRPRTSWSASTTERKSHDNSISPPVPTVKIRIPENHHIAEDDVDDDDEDDAGLAYYEHNDMRYDSKQPLSTNPAALQLRPYTPSASENTSFRTSATSSATTASTSRRISHLQSDSADRDLVNLPPLPPSIPPSRYATPVPTPPRQSSPSPSNKAALKPSRSKVSLAQSEGEDMDAFHVRNTYAQLEASGVRGDGFEDGVERTRARVGPSRSSQLNADLALDDGTEKSKTLGPKELATLASVDR
ncbi:hypothetical protein H0H93_016789 [Arthromyces matolae]|nr:hypothetical protein H0H93_016789 [Arthromyces matolae]